MKKEAVYVENAGGGSWCGGSGRSLSSVACSKLGGSSSRTASFGSGGVSWASMGLVVGRFSMIMVDGREEVLLPPKRSGNIAAVPEAN